MKWPWETIARHILPAFRSLIAKGLVENYGFTQVAAAEKLGTTQAAISYYLSSKRGEKLIKKLENDPQARSIIREIVDELAAETLISKETPGKFCDLCLSLRKRDPLDNPH